MHLEQALKMASYKIWDELEPCGNVSHLIHTPREEALTSMGLKAISNASCISVQKIEMISSDLEKKRGYDFEIAFGSKTNWIRFFIQAKRLYGHTVKDNYDSLDYDQADKLIAYSKNNIGLPTFALYNYLSESDIILHDYYNSITPFDRKSLGVTLTSALSIKMLNSKRFDKHHYNDGKRVNTYFKSLKSFEYLFYFYSYYNVHLSVPFHELSYLTIDLAETINKLYRKRQAKESLPLLLLFLPWSENLMGNDGELIPIIRKTSSDDLISDFKRRNQDGVNEEGIFNPETLLIINTNE